MNKRLVGKQVELKWSTVDGPMAVTGRLLSVQEAEGRTWVQVIEEETEAFHEVSTSVSDFSLTKAG